MLNIISVIHHICHIFDLVISMKLSMKLSMLATTGFPIGTRTASRIRAGLHGRSERSFGAATDVAERHGAGAWRRSRGTGNQGNARGTPGELILRLFFLVIQDIHVEKFGEIWWIIQ